MLSALATEWYHIIQDNAVLKSSKVICFYYDNNALGNIPEHSTFQGGSKLI